MSTVNAQNFGDGTSSVPTSALLEGTAKAYQFYNQSVPVINASYNVSSITDTAAGDSTTNFTNVMSSGNYGVASTRDDNLNTTIGNFSVFPLASGGTDPTSSALRMAAASTAGAGDVTFGGLSVHGDLA